MALGIRHESIEKARGALVAAGARVAGLIERNPRRFVAPTRFALESSLRQPDYFRCGWDSAL